MKMVKYYLIGAVIAAFATWFIPYWPLKVIFGWIFFSLSAVSFAYIFNYPSLFRKREDGTIPFYIRWLFIPFLLGTGAYNAWARKHDEVPAIQRIETDLFLACRLSNNDVETLKQQGVTAILDVTAEFDGLDWSAQFMDCHYLNIPVLDHTSPTTEQLNTAINWIAQQIKDDRKVVVHCALGRGRSVLIVAAYLLAKNPQLSIDDAMGQIQQIRSTARLNKKQLAALTKIKQGGHIKFTQSLAIIANPVAGGGKWKQEKPLILSLLNPHFRVTVLETTIDIDAKQRGLEALNDGADVLVACGGDGTVTEVASVCVNTKTTLGVIPLGTANALSQVLHGYLSRIIPIQTACDIIINGHTTIMDTASCNDELVLMVAALGFEQQMIAAADRNEKNEGGQFAYLRGLWKAISANEVMDLRVRFDDEQQEQEITTPSFVIANAAPLTTALAQGGEQPDITDGKADITWLLPQDEEDNQLLSLAELVLADKQTKQASERICHQQARSITLSLAQETPYAVDGEIRHASEIRFIVSKKNLQVLTSPD
ncbi:diacylglycerol kinase family protein [Alteromonas sp. C1M14]|uniref:diacylglycerol kinase family protein n=1 Tax=Alteromonas sp. C1M14 TaxID=2841567 RepID=UPI001C095EF0|nr:diacylglycerol kinase family protein [Alteromonas sp. C1M14]MBU2977006.1 dual specificity protein phosphatase family protein [Alteromonas sp. C1M14]